MLFMVPFLLLLFSFLVLSNTGRNLKEKLTIFIFNPEDAPASSSGMMKVLRIIFWLSLFLSAWIITGLAGHAG
jgi:hypothetical protein